jgi:hypothetical protein
MYGEGGVAGIKIPEVDKRKRKDEDNGTRKPGFHETILMLSGKVE